MTATVHSAIESELAELAPRLREISAFLHQNPELSMREFRAAELLAGTLADAGFTVRRGVADLDTAFVASAGGPADPRVGLLMEYDALPELGHACGHNLIAAASLGAAIALRRAVPPEVGSVVAIGTPAEESGAGKAVMADAGAFDGLAAAMMFHPGVTNWTGPILTAAAAVTIVFHGKAAHPTGDPRHGVDALAALIQTFNGVGAIPTSGFDNIYGIIREGGSAPNIICDRAVGQFMVRGASTGDVDWLLDRLLQTAHGAATATGAELSVTTVLPRYDHLRRNPALEQEFERHAVRLGVVQEAAPAGLALGSSDIGNVSVKVPTIHPFLRINDAGESDHTPAFCAAAGSDAAQEVMLTAAEALACTAAEVLLNPEFAQRCKDDFAVAREAES